MLDVLKNLAAIRKRLGYSQSDVAHMLGMGQPNIARMEKLENWQSLTLGNIYSWLSICGLSNHTDAIYLDKLSRIETDAKVHLFRSLEQLMLACGVKGSLYTKPLCAIVCSDSSDRLLQTEVCRLLAVNSGDRLFLGFYQPSPCTTVLLKHVSERPPWLDSHVYILDGVMDSGMRNSPNAFLNTALDESWEIKCEGGFSILSDAPAGSIAVVYTDHPLLKHIDVLQPSESSNNLQDYSNFKMSISADISLLCNESSVELSPVDTLRAVAAGRPPDILVSRDGRSISTLRSGLTSLFDNEIVTLFVSDHSKLIDPDQKAIGRLLENILQLCKQAIGEAEMSVKDPKYKTSKHGYVNDRIAPDQGSEFYKTILPTVECLTSKNLDYPLSSHHIQHIYKIIQQLRLSNISKLEPSLRASMMIKLSKKHAVSSMECEVDPLTSDCSRYSYTPKQREFITKLSQNIKPLINA